MRLGRATLIRGALPTDRSEQPRRWARVWPAVRAASIASTVAGLVGLGLASMVRRVVVEGTSMLPTLEPGDRLVAVRLPPGWPVRAGALVAVRDPRDPRRVLVKRVRGGRPGRIEVLGDNRAASTDSRHFGPLARSALVGRCVYRYGPPGRSGRLA